MFKSLSQKTAVLFTLCFGAFFALTLCLQTGFAIYNSKNHFSDCINKVFTEERINQLTSITQTQVNSENSSGIAENSDKAKLVFDSLMSSASTLELGFSRSMSVLNDSGEIIYTSDYELTEIKEKTPVIAKALVGEKSISTSLLKG